MHKGMPRYALYQCARVWYALQCYTMFYPAILSIDGTDVCIYCNMFVTFTARSYGMASCGASCKKSN